MFTPLKVVKKYKEEIGKDGKDEEYEGKSANCEVKSILIEFEEMLSEWSNLNGLSY